ncbi:MAG: aminotransferase class I/II-fold pyridoxal phosphate-dependent enzyme [Bacteroidales bacterium]|nr:aminotransferase class I/II-fold pyridoxal phosphate-dependent enzyme [Bacteroidales bacterium]
MKAEPAKGYDVLRDCALLEKKLTFANLFDLICAHGDAKAAMWMDGSEIKTITYNRMRQLTDNYAAVLAKKFPDGRRVCISLDTCKEWFPLFWGLVRSGHDVLTVDASFPDDKVVKLMQHCRCTDIVCAKERNLPAGYTQMLMSEFEDIPEVTGYKPVWGHNLALCTSGTTSESRVFVYDEDSICHLTLFSSRVHKENPMIIDNMPFRSLAFLPFHHILGFSAVFIWCHFVGYTLVYLKDRSPITITRTAKKLHVNLIIAVPLLANSISKTVKSKVANNGVIVHQVFKVMTGLSILAQRIAPKAGLQLAKGIFKETRNQIFGNDIKCIILGGSHTDAESLRLLNAIGYYTVCGFGMTETAINSLDTSLKLRNRLQGSIGMPLPYTEYRIKHDENYRRDRNQGELQVRGKAIHDGRFVDGKYLPADVDADGWFSTGDIARINEAGRQIFIEGRIKEVIINESGENVYPDDLEELFHSIDGIKQFTVLGLAREKSRYEDIAAIFNVKEKITDEFFLDDLSRQIRLINKDLPAYKRLTRALATGNNLPVANGFKVKRLALKKMIEEGEFPYVNLDLSPRREDTDVSSQAKKVALPQNEKTNQLVMMVRAIYAQVLNIPAESIDPDAHFIDDLGGDSLNVLTVVTKAEDAFGVMIPTDSYLRCATINGAVELLNELVYGTGGTAKQQLTYRSPITNFEDTPEFKSFAERRERLIASGHNPYFVCHESPLRDTSIVDGKEILDFGNYNYVGMSGRKEVSEAAKAAIDKYGTSASGSRLLAGEKKVHQELEAAIAKWKHAEASIVCVGGHSTNVTVVGNFCGKNDLILYDALAHNSIEQGCKLSDAVARPFTHNDVDALEHILKAQRKYFEKVLIVIEGAYSMDGDIADVPGFVALKKKYGCFLMVDEAHSACVLGPTGGGVDEYFGLAPDDIDLKMGTLSKGLGTCGGYIAGKKDLIDYLHYSLPGFVFSVGMSPALAAASLEAINLLQKNPEIMKNLHRNIEFFASEARKRHLDIGVAGKTAIIPVIVGPDENAVALSNALGEKGISVPPALYPAVPKNKARLRFDVCSEHKPEQITKALDTLIATAKELGIELPQRIY